MLASSATSLALIALTPTSKNSKVATKNILFTFFVIILLFKDTCDGLFILSTISLI